MNFEEIPLGDEQLSDGPMYLMPPSPVQNILRAIDDLKAIRTFVASEMKEGVDFGAIPGTSDKKVLLLAGGQKVCMYFNLRPVYRVTRTELGNGHLEVYIETDLIHRSDEKVYGSGVGLCTTMETKYRFRNMERTCPKCEKATIYRGKKFKDSDPETWFCWRKKGGCGSVFAVDDKTITSQEEGQKENENIYDVRNTALKIGAKRSFLSGVVGVGCLSELFTVDLEDFFDLETKDVKEEPPRPPRAESKTNAVMARELLEEAVEMFKMPQDYGKLLETLQRYEVSARRLSVWEEVLTESQKAFVLLRDKIGAETLLPVPMDHPEHWLAFYALDEAYRKGDRDAANKIFFSCKESMAKLGSAWKDYAAELKKAVTV